MRCAWMVWATWAALGASAWAAEEGTNRPGAVNDPHEAGPELAFVGEYTGLVSGGPRRVPVGLQVYATGDGQLRVVEYAGGLPGAGWDRGERRQWDGACAGALARCDGEERQLMIVGQKAWLRDGRGVLRGLLQRRERHSPTLGALPPAEAIVLFGSGEEGSEVSTEELLGARVSPEGWLCEGARTQRSFGDFFLHAEFRLPYMPRAEGQGRANSGFYLQERYEVQVLDSFGLEGVENECGALYKQRRPDMNMCLPPLVWQTYDIEFRAARFGSDGRQKTESARITVRHNGVVIHDNVEIIAKTGNGKPETPEPRPIVLQNHGNPVRFRNVWIIERDAQPVELAWSEG